MYTDTSQKRQNGEITSCPLMEIEFDWTQPSGILEPAGSSVKQQWQDSLMVCYEMLQARHNVKTRYVFVFWMRKRGCFVGFWRGSRVQDVWWAIESGALKNCHTTRFSPSWSWMNPRRAGFFSMLHSCFDFICLPLFVMQSPVSGQTCMLCVIEGGGINVTV